MSKIKKHHKRYGHHQKHTSQFLKTYWPYMPLALIISAMLLLSFGMHKVGRGVLAYTTDVTSQELLTDTNQQRLANDVPALQLNKRLAAAAQAKANDMTTRDYWSHNTPEGNPPWVFINKTGYNYQKAGENLAYGFANGSDTVTGWMDSPPHRENLLDSTFQEVGFGYANVQSFQGHGQETVVVAMYGRPVTAPIVASTTAHPAKEAPAGLSTLSASVDERAPHTVSVIQLISGGRWPWLNGLLVGVALTSLLTLLVRHSLALRRMVRQSERFALHHPIFDLTIVSFLGLCAMLIQVAGVIK